MQLPVVRFGSKIPLSVYVNGKALHVAGEAAESLAALLSDTALHRVPPDIHLGCELLEDVFQAERHMAQTDLRKRDPDYKEVPVAVVHEDRKGHCYLITGFDAIPTVELHDREPSEPPEPREVDNLLNQEYADDERRLNDLAPKPYEYVVRMRELSRCPSKRLLANMNNVPPYRYLCGSFISKF